MPNACLQRWILGSLAGLMVPLTGSFVGTAIAQTDDLVVPTIDTPFPSLPTETFPKPDQGNEQPIHLEIHLSQRRVWLYQGDRVIKRYPIAVGRPGWETPKGNFQVKELINKPKWIHPLTGEAIAGGDPENPLGNHWIGFWTDGKNWVGFHGTPNPESVGKAVSHGCIRMYNKDVAELFKTVKVGTPVKVVP